EVGGIPGCLRRGLEEDEEVSTPDERDVQQTARRRLALGDAARGKHGDHEVSHGDEPGRIGDGNPGGSVEVHGSNPRISAVISSELYARYCQPGRPRLAAGPELPRQHGARSPGQACEIRNRAPLPGSDFGEGARSKWREAAAGDGEGAYTDVRDRAGDGENEAPRSLSPRPTPPKRAANSIKEGNRSARRCGGPRLLQSPKPAELPRGLRSRTRPDSGTSRHTRSGERRS